MNRDDEVDYEEFERAIDKWSAVVTKRGELGSGPLETEQEKLAFIEAHRKVLAVHAEQAPIWERRRNTHQEPPTRCTDADGERRFGVEG